jgi:hypothetical protein
LTVVDFSSHEFVNVLGMPSGVCLRIADERNQNASFVFEPSARRAVARRKAGYFFGHLHVTFSIILKTAVGGEVLREHVAADAFFSLGLL